MQVHEKLLWQSVDFRFPSAFHTCSRSFISDQQFFFIQVSKVQMNFLTLENFYNSDKLYPCSNIEFSFHSSVQIHSDYVYKICFSQFPVFYLQKNEFYAYIIFPKRLSYFFLFVTTKTSQLSITKQIFVLNHRQFFFAIFNIS